MHHIYLFQTPIEFYMSMNLLVRLEDSLFVTTWLEHSGYCISELTIGLHLGSKRLPRSIVTPLLKNGKFRAVLLIHASLHPLAAGSRLGVSVGLFTVSQEFGLLFRLYGASEYYDGVAHVVSSSSLSPH